MDRETNIEREDEIRLTKLVVALDLTDPLIFALFDRWKRSNGDIDVLEKIVELQKALAGTGK